MRVKLLGGKAIEGYSKTGFESIRKGRPSQKKGVRGVFRQKIESYSPSWTP